MKSRDENDKFLRREISAGNDSFGKTKIEFILPENKSIALNPFNPEYASERDTQKHHLRAGMVRLTPKASMFFKSKPAEQLNDQQIYQEVDAMFDVKLPNLKFQKDPSGDTWTTESLILSPTLRDYLPLGNQMYAVVNCIDGMLFYSDDHWQIIKSNTQLKALQEKLLNPPTAQEFVLTPEQQLELLKTLRSVWMTQHPNEKKTAFDEHIVDLENYLPQVVYEGKLQAIDKYLVHFISYPEEPDNIHLEQNGNKLNTQPFKGKEPHKGGWVMMNIDGEQRMMVFEHVVGLIQHSTPTSANAVVGAGMIETNINGKIIEINNCSGHYHSLNAGHAQYFQNALEGIPSSAFEHPCHIQYRRPWNNLFIPKAREPIHSENLSQFLQEKLNGIPGNTLQDKLNKNPCFVLQKDAANQPYLQKIFLKDETPYLMPVNHPSLASIKLSDNPDADEKAKVTIAVANIIIKSPGFLGKEKEAEIVDRYFNSKAEFLSYAKLALQNEGIQPTPKSPSPKR